MALSRETVAAIIEVVAADNLCRSVINKAGMPRLVQAVAPWLAMAGAYRNAQMQMYEWYSDVPPASSEDSGSPYMMERICVGIANAVQEAATRALFTKKLNIPIDYSQHIARVRNDTFFGHYANKVVSSDGGEYVLDWWMTLEIRNPMVWRYSEWRQYPLVCGTVGCPFSLFRGFK